MFPAFYHWLFRKFLRVTLFCIVGSLEVLSLNVLDAEIKVPDKEIFPHHTIANLNSDIKFYCYVQSGEFFTVKGNKHTHTYTYMHTLVVM